MDDEVVIQLIRIGVLTFIAVSGLVRVLAALFFSSIRQSVVRHRGAHAFWFTASAVALIVVLQLVFSSRQFIRLSPAANNRTETNPAIALRLQAGIDRRGVVYPTRHGV
jgi:hypothetical protein